LGLETKDIFDSENQAVQHLDPNGTGDYFVYNGDGFLAESNRKNSAEQTLVTRYRPDTFGCHVSIVDARGITKQQIFSQRSLMIGESARLWF